MYRYFKYAFGNDFICYLAAVQTLFLYTKIFVIQKSSPVRFLQSSIRATLYKTICDSEIQSGQVFVIQYQGHFWIWIKKFNRLKIICYKKGASRKESKRCKLRRVKLSKMLIKTNEQKYLLIKKLVSQICCRIVDS